MTWESVDLSKLPVAPLYGIAALVIVGSFAFLRDTPAFSIETLCAERGGEWLNGSEKPTCVMKDGKFLVFDEAAKDFVDPSAPKVLAAVSPQSLPLTKGEPEGVGNPVRGVEEVSDTTCSDRFSDYPIEGVMNDRQAAVDFSTWPDAAKYRSAIARDYARGANFADHYVVSSWGCPDFEGCEGHAVIDRSNGKILSYGETSLGTDFNKESRLLIVSFKDQEERYLVNSSTNEFGKCN